MLAMMVFHQVNQTGRNWSTSIIVSIFHQRYIMTAFRDAMVKLHHLPQLDTDVPSSIIMLAFSVSALKRHFMAPTI
jgi:hypothetical protein